MGRIPQVVRMLLLVNAAFFVASFLLPGTPGTAGRMVEWFAFWFPRHEHFAVWQVVTYMFMHGGLGHIFFNLFALLSFGLPLELRWGARRFFVFYFLCGIGAGLIYTGVNWIEFDVIQNRLLQSGVPVSAIEPMLQSGRYPGPVSDPEIKEAMVKLYRLYNSPMLGASGAIYGIFVAFGLLYPNAKLQLMFLPVPIAAKYFIPVLLALDLLSGVTGFSLFGGGIAHFAHLGGALIGFLLMWHWRGPTRRPAADVGF